MDSVSLTAEAEAEEARRLALALSSDDLAEARSARETLADWLSPTRTLRLWQNGTAAHLITEAQSAANPSVHAAIARGLRRLFSDPAVASSFFAMPGATEAATQFLATSIAHEDLTIATAVRPAFLALLASAPSSDAAAIGALLDATLSSPELALRLFDQTDGADTLEQTAAAIRFAAAHTSALDRIVSAALLPDPLLRASCLVVCGTAGRVVPLPEHLLTALTEMLRGGAVDDFIAAATAVAVLLESHERNAELPDGPDWAAAAASKLRCGVPDIVMNSAAQVLMAFASTEKGWSNASIFVQPDALAPILTGTRGVGREAVLGLLSALVRLPHVNDAVFPAPLLMAAWGFRAHVEPSLRGPLWAFLADGLSRPAVAAVLAMPCASFLTADSNEPETAIRELQLRAASHLASDAQIPAAVQARIEAFRARGLYTPGSAGVEAMARR